MKNFLILALTLICVTAAFGQKSKIEPKDLAKLEGAPWTGTLTYLDYSSGKPTAIKCDVTITRDAKDSHVWTFDYRYPDEPKANSKDSVVLSADGRTFDGEAVLEFSRKGKTSRLVTTKQGKDNDKPATFRFTYLFDDKNFSVRKEVKVDGSADYFERNRYAWSR